MIQLQIEGQFLDMNPDTALNISVNSPFFSTDTIAGSTVYDFEIPFSDHNNRLLRYSGVESVSTITGSYPVIVYYNGSPFKEGILYIKSIRTTYNCYVSLDAGLLKAAIADKDLSDLPLEPLEIKDVKIDADYPFVTLRAQQLDRWDPFYTLLISRKLDGTDYYTAKYKIKKPGRTGAFIPVVYFLEKFVNLINAGSRIERFVTGRAYRLGSNYVAYTNDRYGNPVYRPTEFVNKYFWVNFGGVGGLKRLVKVNRPDSYTGAIFRVSEPELYPSWWYDNNYFYEIADDFENDASIDEECGWFKNQNNIRASIVGAPTWPVLEYSTIDPDIDEAGYLAETAAFVAAYDAAYVVARVTYEACTDIKIEDLSNGNPSHLSIDTDFGYIKGGWEVVDSYTEPIIAGFDPAKIAARLQESYHKTYPAENFIVAPVRNEKFLGDDTDFLKYQNNIDSDANLILNSNTIGTRNRNVFTAFPYNNYVLDSIFKLASLTLYGGLLNDAELNTVCIWNNFSNDMVLVDEADPTNQLRVPSTIIDLRQNLKGTSIKDFLYANRKTFGVDFIYRANGAVQCVFKKDIALSIEADDWSAKEIPQAEIYIEDDINGFAFLPSSDTDAYYSSVIKPEETYQIAEDVNTLTDLEAIQNDPINTIRGVLSDFEGIYIKLYRCTFRSDYKYTWVFFGLRIANVTLGDGKNTIQSEIGVPLMYYNYEGAFFPIWTIPRVDTEGRSLFTLTDQSTAGLKFMFYRGLKEDMPFADAPIPLISTIYSTNSLSEFNYSLHINGEKNYASGDVYDNTAKGTYESFWKDWCAMLMNARKVQKRFALTQLDILQLDIAKKKYANGKTYLIQKIDYEIGRNETIIATADCWRL